VRQACKVQDVIGWGPFLEGWIATEWEVIQQECYNHIESRRTGKKWSAGLIKQLWAIGRVLWEHRNEALHKKTNQVTQRMEDTLNERPSSRYHKAIESLV
jgi:hypothetical protein